MARWGVGGGGFRIVITITLSFGVVLWERKPEVVPLLAVSRKGVARGA